MLFPIRTIKAKFIIVTTLFIILTVGIPFFFLLQQFKLNFQQRSEAMLTTTLDVVYEGIMNAMMLCQQKNIQEILDEVGKNQSITHIRIYDKKGVILFSTNHQEKGSNVSEFGPHHTQIVNQVFEYVELKKGKNVYSVARPIENKPYCQDCHKQKKTIAYLDVDVSLTPAERAFYTGSFHIIMLSVLIVIFLVSGFYFLFNRYINKPLQSFISALDRVKAGNLNIRLPEKKKDEFGVLEQHFNHMVNTLKDSREQIEKMHIEELQRADKLVTLGELAAEMAHEINNPAAVILTRSDFLRLELENEQNGNSSKYLEDLDVIISQTNKISRITNSILKFSKKLPRDFREVNILKIIDESLHILEPRLKSKNIQQLTEYQCDYNCKEAIIYGDENQLEQMLTNLFNNAIDAMDDGGILRVKVECLADHSVCLTIIDNGCGMDEKTQNNIFNPFYTTKGRKNGTGLGLYIVKNICKNHNAEISCSSTLREGTTFTITFKRERNR